MTAPQHICCVVLPGCLPAHLLPVPCLQAFPLPIVVPWLQIESDPQAVKSLGWVREMFAFSLACAVERLELELHICPASTLIAQPPVDLRLGNATQVGAQRRGAAADDVITSAWMARAARSPVWSSVCLRRCKGCSCSCVMVGKEDESMTTCVIGASCRLFAGLSCPAK